MFDDLFGEDAGKFFDNDNADTFPIFAVANDKQKLRSLADEHDQPPLLRNLDEFSGLKNQGGTCYLNALFQAFYVCPEFRQFFYDIDLEKLPEIEKNSDKYKIIKELQLLLARLEFQPEKNQITTGVTNSFGWMSNEHAEQQDIAEANRMIIDMIERALFGTGLDKVFNKTFKGKLQNYVECLTCGNKSANDQEYYDQLLTIKNWDGQKFKSVDESLNFMLVPELLSEGNQYNCEICNVKVDALKGQKLASLPDVLCFGQNRFELCYETFERKKINCQYLFDLELDMGKYVDFVKKEGEFIYDLQGMLIHRGNAYGGHYHAVLRDILLKKKSQQNHKNSQKQNLSNNDDSKAFDMNLDKWGIAISNNEDCGIVDEMLQKCKDIGNEKIDKKNFLVSNKTKQESAVDNVNNKEKGDKKTQQDTEADFPTKVILTEELKYLTENWIDFDDTRVDGISYHKLSKYFGGSTESAYVLFYRKRSLEVKSLDICSPPEYIMSAINAEISEANEQNKKYEEMKLVKYVQFKHLEDVVDLDLMTFQPDGLSIGDSSKCFEQAINEDKDNVQTLFQRLHNETGAIDNLGDNWMVLEYDKTARHLVYFPKMLTNSSCHEQNLLNLKNFSFYHKHIYLLAKMEPSTWNVINSNLGEANMPVMVNILADGKNSELILKKFCTQKSLLKDLEMVVGFPVTNIAQIKVRLGTGDCLRLENQLGKQKRQSEILEDEMLQEVMTQADMIKEDHKEVKVIAEGDENFKEIGDFRSILVQRYDREGTSRYIVDFRITMSELLKLIKAKMDIQQKDQWRLKFLQNDQFIYKDQMDDTFYQLGFEETGQRILLEQGEFPEKGQFTVYVYYKIRTTAQQNPESTDKPAEEVSTISYPIQVKSENTLQELKTLAGDLLKLNMEDHEIYLMNFFGEPTKGLYGLNKKLIDLKISGKCDVLVQHKSIGQSSSRKSFSVYFSPSGLPNDNDFYGVVNCTDSTKLFELKEGIFDVIKDKLGLDQLNINLLKVREFPKSKYPGRVQLDDKKTLSKLKVQVTCLFVSILNELPDYKSDDIHLFIRQRNIEDKVYMNYEEFVFKTQKSQTYEKLEQQLKDTLGVSHIVQLKYFYSEFEWRRIGPSKNLTKDPTFLKSGDVIGYLPLASLDHEKRLNDDFQTQEDLELKKLHLEFRASEATNKKHGGDDAQFKMNIDF